MEYYLAIDIGASSGRHIIGWEEDGQLKTDEVFRFPNGMQKLNGHLVWDIDSLEMYVKKGIGIAIKKYKTIKSLAIDTWGVDYVLMNHDKPITPCFAYRDNRTEAVIDKVHSLIPFSKLYHKTGIQFQPFNSIYQLYCDKLEGRLNDATDFLMIPEYLNQRLTGKKAHEYTNATTTGLVDVNTGEYDKEIISALGLPERLFGKLCHTGESVGMLKPDVAAEVGGQTEVVLCASHDTASAVEGIPMTHNSPYISSGTWSLLGLKVSNAITNDESLKANFTNEGGVGYIRYQKNIMGMWIVNKLREELCPEKPFPVIMEEARCSSFERKVDVNDSLFLSPESMKEAIDIYLKRERDGQKLLPRSDGDYFRCAIKGLAESYKNAITELRNNTGTDFNSLYIVGGGAKNTLLNEMTEQACCLTVKALPIEATAIGNLKIQMGRK